MTDGAQSPYGRTSIVALFISRPVLAAVLSLLIALAGIAAMLGVEVRELPDVDQPVVSVRASYPGATPETIDAEVTAVIENAVTQIDGVVSISSSSSFARSSVVAEFSPSVNIDVAAADVKNAVSGIQGRLPDGVEEPSVVKADADGSPIMRIIVSAPDLSEGELGDLVQRIIQPRLQAVDGVASVEDYGIKNRVIRVRLSPVQLAARGISVDDVARLVRAARVSVPSGTLRTGRQELLIRAEAPAASPEDIGALRINPDTLLSDIAVVEWSVARESTMSRYNGAPSAGLGILRQAQSNTVAVSQAVRAALAELERAYPKVKLVVAVDDSIYISRAIEEVVTSLLLSIAIVVGVIFLFLRSARATLIPAIAIPVSLLGTIAAVWLAGFSINILSLLALVMATGLVVDDAIVVTENVQRWRSMGAGRRAAALLGTKEIVFAVLATTVTLAAVFIPISFMPGQAGRLFTEFGFVLAFAVLLSSVVALTLCPMLTVFLTRPPKPDGGATDRGRIAAVGAAGRDLYKGALTIALRRPLASFVAALLFAGGAYGASRFVEQELTPQEDRGRIFANVRVQQSANIDYMREKVAEIERRMQPLVERGDAVSVMSAVGLGSSSRAFVILRLADWSERDKTQAEIESELRPALSSIAGADVQMRGSNSLGIRGSDQGLQFAVAAENYAAAADAAEALAARLEQNAMFTRASMNFETAQPKINIDIDRDAAARLGVDVSSVAALVNAMSDELKVAELFVGDQIVDVLLTAGGEPIDDPQDLENLFVRTGGGQFVPLSLIAQIRETAVAANLSREERRRAVNVTAALADGASLGEAIGVMREEARASLPVGMSVILLGEARLLQSAQESVWIVFAFAAVIVLLVLAAQFESFISAFVIMLTVPFGLAAAVFAMALTGTSFNYYSQIGLVLLIGVMAKNGILIVEFANQLRDRGADLHDAILNASLTRLRPVLMTALSTVLGGLPLVLASGAGAESRAALGWVVVGGLGFATLFTLFLTPAAYMLLARFSKVRAQEARLVAQELADAEHLLGPQPKAAE